MVIMTLRKRKKKIMKNIWNDISRNSTVIVQVRSLLFVWVLDNGVKQG